MFLHNFSSIVCVALIFIIIFRLATGKKVKSVARIVFLFFFIVILPPIIDLIISSGKGLNITYLFPETHRDIWYRFFTFGGDYKMIGVTPGMRIEVAIALFLSFLYFYLSTSKLFRSIFYVFLIYFSLFLVVITPFFVKFIFWLFHMAPIYYNTVLFQYYMLIILFQGIFLAYLASKDRFLLIIKDIRLPRIAHALLMFMLGAVIGLKGGHFVLSAQNLFHFLLIPVSIIFACLAAILVNNVEDHEIDRVSNRERPLAAGLIDLGSYKKLIFPFLAAAFLFSAAVSSKALFIILLCILNYLLYSVPPIRLKRVPVLSKIAVSLNSLFVIMLGFIVANGSLTGFPQALYPVILLGFTLAANFIDLKDYEGDKKAGLKTLPTIFGHKKSKVIIGSFFVIAYLLMYFVLNEIAALPALIVLGALQFCFINRENYDERPIFVVHLLSILMLIFYVFMFVH
jgi:4-hydroxybenzoate polyprenyltransferase